MCKPEPCIGSVTPIEPTDTDHQLRILFRIFKGFLQCFLIHDRCLKLHPAHGPEGFDQSFDLHPVIETVRKGKVRRAKLYYLRERFGKAAKVKERV